MSAQAEVRLFAVLRHLHALTLAIICVGIGVQYLCGRLGPGPAPLDTIAHLAFPAALGPLLVKALRMQDAGWGRVVVLAVGLGVACEAGWEVAERWIDTAWHLSWQLGADGREDTVFDLAVGFVGALMGAALLPLTAEMDAAHAEARAAAATAVPGCRCSSPCPPLIYTSAVTASAGQRQATWSPGPCTTRGAQDGHTQRPSIQAIQPCR